MPFLLAELLRSRHVLAPDRVCSRGTHADMSAHERRE
jgi:hypothetical protein